MMSTEKPVEISAGPPLGPRPWSEDWKEHWNEPLLWPRQTGSGRWDVKAHIESRRAIRVNPSRSALVLVDVDKEAYDMAIEDFGRYDPMIGKQLQERIYHTAVPNTIRLVDFFRAQGRPVIFVQWDWHRHQYPPLEPQEGEAVVYKWATGAFGASGLDTILRRGEISAVFFVGSDTSFCLESTVRGAVDYGYRSVVVEDCSVGCLQRLHDCTLLTLGWHLAYIATTAQVIDHYPWQSLPGVVHELQRTS